MLRVCSIGEKTGVKAKFPLGIWNEFELDNASAKIVVFPSQCEKVYPELGVALMVTLSSKR